jgi:regulator of protease activity HflC (stomatin/prohibitin superfamily)
MEIGPQYLDIVVAPNVREAIRGVASGYKVSALYSDTGRAEISQAMLKQLKEKLEPRGIVIEDVLLRSMQLPKTFLQSIEAKLRAEQESFQKEFELQKAVKDAEIEVAQARGVADANKIIAESITAEYIQYLWVQGLNDGNSEVIYVPTEANLPILEASRKKEL